MNRALAIFVSFWWGVGQNMPYDWLYVAGVGPGDFAFLASLAATVASRGDVREFRSLPRVFGLFGSLVFAFVGLTLASIAANSLGRDIAGPDLIEAVRPLYFLVLTVFVFHWTTRFGSSVLTSFLVGVLTAGVVAFLNPSQGDVFGFRVLWNPNVVGNLLAVGCLMSSVLLLQGRSVSAFVFLFCFLVLSVFTYSKGTWLMCLLGFLACLCLAAASAEPRTARAGRVALVTSLAVVIALAATYSAEIVQLVQFKLETTQLGDTASEGGTFAARFGFLIATLHIAVDNPILGVGISNFEVAYDELREVLGANYWATDNPHSAWLYVLACIGIPALVVVVTIVITVLLELRRPIAGRNTLVSVYIGLVAITLAVSGAVILHLVTQYYLWFLAGVAFALGRPVRSTPRFPG